MYYKSFLIIAAVCMTLPFLSESAFGHGLGGDAAPPISFEGMEVTIFTQLDPADMTAGEVDSANIAIRFYDMLTDQNLEQVTYRVEVWRSGDLLARNYFYDDDGTLNVEVRPKADCYEAKPWKCTEYYGEVHGTAGGLFARGEGRPLIDGPIFEKGGLYNVKVSIEGATSPRSLVAQPLYFDTFVSVAQDQNFFIKTAEAAEVPVTVKTYYDDVENFTYNQGNNAISFDMPFDWDPEYIELVQMVHEEIRVPKSFDPYNPETSFKGYVDGIEVDQRVLVMDPYSSETENIVHFLVTGTELQRINELLGESHYSSKTMNFQLVPEGTVEKNSFDITFDNGYTALVAWDSMYGAGDEIPFEFSFFDNNGALVKDVIYAFGLVNPQGEQFNLVTGDNPEEFVGTKSVEGISTHMITIPDDGLYTLNLVLTGEGFSNYDEFFQSSQLFEVGVSTTSSFKPTPSMSAPSQTVTIPEWVKNNAAWWSNGEIDDNTFASGIEFMIKQGIISVPTTASGAQNENATIPDWVRNNAAWWADGQIDDNTFASGIQFLVKEGIISV
ncbi:MAG: peptidase [Thermoproteota archaeon]|nr:peptidase [Thermoproteota archaeon]